MKNKLDKVEYGSTKDSNSNTINNGLDSNFQEFVLERRFFLIKAFTTSRYDGYFSGHVIAKTQ